MKPVFRSAARAAVWAGVLALAAVPAARGGVEFDGSLGPIGTISGDMFIRDSMGTQIGSNLFHSFRVFDIDTGESVTFTSDFAGTTDNVIGRVTGGSPSVIDGLLTSTIQGASIWLINPFGMVFGQNARVDVPGSFHASTADHLLLEDGGRFGANLGLPEDTMLSVAEPVSFGFLGPAVSAITVDGATFEVGAGRTLALVGGDIEITGATLAAEGGRIDLASVASAGEVRLDDTGIYTEGIGALGDITLGSVLLDADGDGGGAIFIRGGAFVLGSESWLSARSLGGTEGAAIVIEADSASILDGSTIETGATGSGDAGDIRIEVGGALTMSGMSDGWSSLVTSQTSGEGAGGDIVIDAGSLVLLDGAQISTLAFDDGDAGSITVTAADTVTISGEGAFGASTKSGLFSNTLGAGAGGDITASASDFLLTDGGTINATTFGEAGDAGMITLTAGGTISLCGEDSDGVPTSIVNQTQLNFVGGAPVLGTGRAGDIHVVTGDLELLGGAQISASSLFSFGDAGDITIDAAGTLTVAGQAAADNGSQILTQSTGLGDAGDILVHATDVILEQAGKIDSTAFAFFGDIADGGSIILDVEDTLTISSRDVFGTESSSGLYSRTFGQGSAGGVEVHAGDVEMSDGGLISVRSGAVGAGGDAGAIVLDVAGTLTITGTDAGPPVADPGDPTNLITDTALLSITSNDGAGGTIDVHAGEIVLDGGGGIYAFSAGAGNAGDVGIEAGTIRMTDGSRIETSADLSAGGDVRIEAADRLHVIDSTITAEARGLGPGDDGGNVTIASGGFVILDRGIVRANANAGNGGNIAIMAGTFIASADSEVNASSQLGIDGVITIESVNEITGSVLPLDAPSFGASPLITGRCAAELPSERSSFTIGTRGGVAWGPDAYAPVPLPDPERREESAEPE